MQGDIPSGAFFCMAQQPSLIKLDQKCQEGGGFDNIYVVGRLEVLLPAVLRFQQDLRNRCSLLLQWNTTKWFTWDVELPDYAPP